MDRIWMLLSNLGRAISRWNDPRTPGWGDLGTTSKSWRAIDRVSSRLYVLGDKAGR